MDKLQQCPGTDAKGNKCSLWESHTGAHEIRHRNKDRGAPLRNALIAKAHGLPDQPYVPPPSGSAQCPAVDPHGAKCTLPEGHVRPHGGPQGFARPAPGTALSTQGWGARKDETESVGDLSDARIAELEDVCRYPTYVVSMAREIKASRQAARLRKAAEE